MCFGVEAFMSRRNELITQDRSFRGGYENASLMEAEAKADRVIRSIRTIEAKTIWGGQHLEIPHSFPGMEFLTGRDIVVNTKIFDILKKMPKGALLHAHLDATVDPKVLLKLALRHPELHVRAPVLIDSFSITTARPEFRAFALDDSTNSTTGSMTDSDYNPGDWIPIKTARENFDVTLGGVEGFDQWVYNSLTISTREAYDTHRTIEKIWDKFISTFQASSGLIRYQPVFEAYIREFFLSSIEDKISYIEVRLNFVSRYLSGPDGKENVPHREWMVIFERVLNEVKRELQREGREDEFFGARIIYSAVKYITAEELEWYTEDCLALKQEFPHLIAGFDLVGPENTLNPLIYYMKPLLRFQARQKELGLDIPFLFHAGETLGDGTEADMNLYDALLLGTKRIGHGFSLVKHPKLMERCRENRILVESCPISNEILRLTASVPMHPIYILINHGIPVSLNNDDPAAFGNFGLSYDFYQVLVSSELMGLAGLRELALDSLKYSTLESKEKEHALKNWKGQWAKFVEELVNMGHEQ